MGRPMAASRTGRAMTRAAVAAALALIAACSRGKKAEEAKGAETPAPAATPAPQGGDGFAKMEDFSKFAMFYYQAPAPGRIPAALKYYVASPWLEDPDNVLATAVFFSEVFKRDEKAMSTTFEDVAATGSEDAKVFYLHSLWFVDSKASEALVGRAEAEWKSEKAKAFIGAMRKRSPKGFMEAPIKHPGQLDLQWMRFFATGGEPPIRTLIAVAATKGEATGIDKQLAEMAEWTLQSNGLRHAAVRKVLAEEEAKATGAKKTQLRAMIEEIVKAAADAKAAGAAKPQEP